jgi:hypothetical protein
MADPVSYRWSLSPGQNMLFVEPCHITGLRACRPRTSGEGQVEDLSHDQFVVP